MPPFARNNPRATLDAFDVVCVHGYGSTCIVGGCGDGWAIVNRVKQLTQRAIYITETNLDIVALRKEPAWSQTSWSTSWEEIGRRIVNGLSQWDGPDGQVRGVCAFETDYRNPDPRNYRYHMDTEFNPDLVNEPRNVPSHNADWDYLAPFTALSASATRLRDWVREAIVKRPLVWRHS